MKGKLFFLALICVLVASSGMVFAASNQDQATSEAAVVAPDAAATVQQEQPKSAADMLDALAPDKVDMGACCVADCYDAWSACLLECGATIACRQACRAELTACKSQC